jgi:N-glycosylase/DNA lyase
MAVWNPLPVCRRDLDLGMTLFNGQAFLWTCEKRADFVEFCGSILDSLYALRYRLGDESVQDLSARVEFCVISEKSDIEKSDVDHYARLVNYFNLETNLKALVQTWCIRDAHMALVAPKYSGIRVLTIDIIESLISFLSSSNNNIKRISQMLWRLCQHFPQNKFSCEAFPLSRDFYRFPDLIQLSTLSECTLRKLGFGFRAPYIVSAIQQVGNNGGGVWLSSLSTMKRGQACVALQSLSGCGPKVANCICMCSLRLFDSVPVDTHCLQLMRRYYVTKESPLLRCRSLTARRHTMLGDIMRSIFGDHVSWAFMLLFTAELADFRARSRTQSRFFANASSAGRPPKQPPARLMNFFAGQRGRRHHRRESTTRDRGDESDLRSEEVKAEAPTRKPAEDV